MSPSLDLIREYLSWMKMDGQYEESTITERGRFLVAMDGKLPFGLEKALPEELAEEIHRPASASGRAGYFDHFCGFYRWACDPDDQWLDSNPMVKMRRPRIHNTGINPERLPADEHVAEILAKARDPWLKYAALAMFSGARCIEISRLDREHVTEEWTLLQGKRRKPRRVPTHARVWAIARDLPPGPMARLGDGSRASRQFVSIKTAAYLRNTIGVPVSLHMLRHWCATKALEGGADLRVVQELLGHSSPGVTARYTHINDSQLRRAVASLPLALTRRVVGG